MGSGWRIRLGRVCFRNRGLDSRFSARQKRRIHHSPPAGRAGLHHGALSRGSGRGCGSCVPHGRPAALSGLHERVENGFRFLRQLTIGPEHDAMLPNPAYALGGLRRSLTASEIRLDFVQHSLAAALDLCLSFGLSEASNRSMGMDLNQSRQEPVLQPGD